jgi:MFS family permease
VSALRQPAFRRLAIGWGFSNFGDSALYLTLAVWVKDLTDSDAATGLIFLFLGLPFLLAPFAGHLADRMSRRRLVVLANVAGAALVLTLWTVTDRSDVWVIYLVTFWYGFITYVTSAAGSGLVRDLLPDEHLASGNGLLNTIDQGLRLVSPLAGVGVYALWGGHAIAVLTAVMLLLAAAIVSTVPVVETPPTAREERAGFWTETTAGFRHIRRSALLTRLTVAMAVAFMITGLANTAVFAAIEQGIDQDAEFFGVIAAVQGGGSVLGGITAAAVIARLREVPTMTLALVTLGVGMAMPAIASLPVFVVAALIIGISIPWLMVAFATIRQRSTPGELQGRVSAATNMALNGPQTLGTAAGAALIAVVDYRLLFVAMGTVVAACAVPIATHRADATEAERTESLATTAR